jgi:hypothetical protein
MFQLPIRSADGEGPTRSLSLAHNVCYAIWPSTAGHCCKALSKAPARDLVSIDYIAAVTAMLTLVGAELITGDVM